MKTSIALAAVLVLIAAPRLVQAAPSAGHCAAAPYHQLDFWLGDWDTFDVGIKESSQARNHVTRILGGCVIHERYVSNHGMVGESFSIYDAARKLWHQTWVTNDGHLLVLEGGMRDGRVVLEGNDRDAHGKPVTLRAWWWPVAGGVRERSMMSGDGGKSWKMQFDIVFRPHTP
ncbi:MAG TPA: hypothetical protein VFW60_08410 [Rhodanobacteraceae bacterium]|nr:hypothetical protein [Rhodanobacteraceae bacterium]